MRIVGLKTLKNKLSEYVRMAAGGEVVLISDRDRIVAELTPPRETRGRAVPDAALADAVRKGVLTPSILPPGAPPTTTPVAPLEEILAELADDRADR
ncbi:MAG: type II toxin-antitoxin system Phd/YefM family antitoxin [Actinomycetota bacterium]